MRLYFISIITGRFWHICENIKHCKICSSVPNVISSQFVRFILQITQKCDISQTDPWVKLMSEALHSWEMLLLAPHILT